MSYGTDPFGRQVYGGQSLPPVLVALAAWGRSGLRAVGQLAAKAALAARSRGQLRAQARLDALAALGTGTTFQVHGHASCQGSVGLAAKGRLALRPFALLDRYYLVIEVQAINSGDIVVAGEMKEWQP